MSITGMQSSPPPAAPTQPPGVLWSGSKFQAVRESLGLGQQEAAQFLGMSRISLWRWESGRRRVDAKAQARLHRLAHSLAIIADHLERDHVTNGVLQVPGDMDGFPAETVRMVAGRLALLRGFEVEYTGTDGGA